MFIPSLEIRALACIKARIRIDFGVNQIPVITEVPAPIAGIVIIPDLTFALAPEAHWLRFTRIEPYRDSELAPAYPVPTRQPVPVVLRSRVTGS